MDQGWEDQTLTLQPPNFAGHYVLATWGCGTQCTQVAIVDLKTGFVYHPDRYGSVVADGVQPEILDGSWYATGALRFSATSRLLVMFGTPQENIMHRGISYLVWGEDHKFKSVRFISKR